MLSAPAPGIAGQTNSITATWPVEGETVYFAYSLSTGSTPIPGCTGETAGLSAPQILGVAAVAANGEATIQFSVPQAAAGLTVYFQALQRDSCSLSDVIQHTFQ
jgi:hypothetical protein